MMNISTFQTTNGGKPRWCASISYYDQDHKRKWVRGYGVTESLAETNLQKNLGKRLSKSHKPNQPKSVTLAAFESRWIDHIRSNGTVASTPHKYHLDMKNHVLPHLGSKSLSTITEDDINELFTVTLTVGTAAKKHTFKELKQLFKYGVDSKVIAENPMSLMKPPKHVNQVKTKQERWMGRWIGITKGLINWLEQPDCPYHEHYSRILILMLGLRKSELLGLTWDCVEYLNRKNKAKLIIKQELMRHETSENVHGWYIAARTKNSEHRIIPLPERHRKALLALKKQNHHGAKGTEWENLIFLKGDHNVTYSDQDRLWKTIQLAYYNKNKPSSEIVRTVRDLPEGFYLREHDLRHVFASYLIANGTPLPTVQDILGHLDSAMTLYYTHITENDKRHAMTMLDDDSK